MKGHPHLIPTCCDRLTFEREDDEPQDQRWKDRAEQDGHDPVGEVLLDPTPEFESVSITAPTTPIKVATTRSTVRRSRKNTLARRAPSGGKRLNSRTAWPALVSLAPNADSAFVPVRR
jgi:hypothetical protein